MKNVIISILLIIVALVLTVLLFIPGFIYQLYAHFKYNEPTSYTYKLLFGIAQVIDEFGNVAYQGMWNEVLIIKESKHLFGNAGERMSSVIGKNVLTNTLTKTGVWLNNQLNKIQPNHSILSIQKEI